MSAAPSGIFAYSISSPERRQTRRTTNEWSGAAGAMLDSAIHSDSESDSDVELGEPPPGTTTASRPPSHATGRNNQDGVNFRGGIFQQLRPAPAGPERRNTTSTTTTSDVPEELTTTTTTRPRVTFLAPAPPSKSRLSKLRRTSSTGATCPTTTNAPFPFTPRNSGQRASFGAVRDEGAVACAFAKIPVVGRRPKNVLSVDGIAGALDDKAGAKQMTEAAPRPVGGALTQTLSHAHLEKSCWDLHTGGLCKLGISPGATPTPARRKKYRGPDPRPSSSSSSSSSYSTCTHPHMLHHHHHHQHLHHNKSSLTNTNSTRRGSAPACVMQVPPDRAAAATSMGRLINSRGGTPTPVTVPVPWTALHEHDYDDDGCGLGESAPWSAYDESLRVATF